MLFCFVVNFILGLFLLRINLGFVFEFLSLLFYFILLIIFIILERVNLIGVFLLFFFILIGFKVILSLGSVFGLGDMLMGFDFVFFFDIDISLVLVTLLILLNLFFFFFFGGVFYRCFLVFFYNFCI